MQIFICQAAKHFQLNNYGLLSSFSYQEDFPAVGTTTSKRQVWKAPLIFMVAPRISLREDHSIAALMVKHDHCVGAAPWILSETTVNWMLKTDIHIFYSVSLLSG